jgi:hypothetical protein
MVQTNNAGHPSHLQPEDIQFLEAKQAFKSPPAETLDALISTFLERVFPLYPLVIRQEFVQQYRAGKLPWILLHAVCFVAATFCPSAVLHRAGFASRKEARFSYYSKTKALFDCGYESNKTVILQCVILMTFWGGGPNNYWNFYSWIGTGVTIAETLGIHRTLDGTNMKSQDRSLLKRLWWILVIRDASCGALVGRPFRINMDHCDTEMLTEADFSYDDESPEFSHHPMRRVYGLYQIHVAKLFLILRTTVTTSFNGTKRTPPRMEDMQSIQEWRDNLPAELTWTESTKHMNVFTSCLSILYNMYLILANMGSLAPDNNSMCDNDRSSTRHVPENAAHHISTVASSIVTKSQVLMMPHETFHGLFLAGVVFYTQMKSSQAMVAQLGRTALNNCQLVLANATDAYDPSSWISNIFDNLTSKVSEDTSKHYNLGENSVPDDRFGGTITPYFDGTIPIGGGSVTDFGDLWQSNPSLSTFFELSRDDMFLGSDQSLFPQCFGEVGNS